MPEWYEGPQAVEESEFSGDSDVQEDPNWLERHPEVRLTPYTEREIGMAKDDYARAVASGQYDQVQLEELWDKTDDYVNKVQRSSAEEQPSRAKDTLQQQFEERVLDIQGKLIQQDPETGRFEVLSEPVKDERKIEEMQFQHQMDIEKGRIDLMKQLSGLTTGTTEGGQKPMYSPDQIRQEVDRLLPETNQEQGLPTPEQFDQQWSQLTSGETLTGPDGNTYRKM